MDRQYHVYELLKPNVDVLCRTGHPVADGETPACDPWQDDLIMEATSHLPGGESSPGLDRRVRRQRVRRKHEQDF
jgi:hypothetical protein